MIFLFSMNINFSMCEESIHLSQVSDVLMPSKKYLIDTLNIFHFIKSLLLSS